MGISKNATELRLRRGTAAEHIAFVGAEGEVTIDTDNNNMIIHDGTTPGGHAATGLTGPKGDKGDVGDDSTVPGPPGADSTVSGPKGDKGDVGAKPNHQWTGTSLQVELPEGSWGTATDLKGETGADSTVAGPKGDKGDQGDSFQIDDFGTFAERDAHDDAGIGFTYLVTSTGDLYIKNSATPGDWSAAIPFGSGVHDHDDLYFTETEVTNALALKSDSTHDHSSDYEPLNTTHDDRYYTETEIDSRFAAGTDATTIQGVDVDATAPSNDAILVYNSTSSKYEPKNKDRHSVNDLGTVATGTIAIDVADGVCQKVTLTGDVTITFTGFVSGHHTSIHLIITDSGGPHTITWTGVSWPDGTAPELTKDSRNRFMIASEDGGTIVDGGFVGGGFA